jgi:hypothetical protein
MKTIWKRLIPVLVALGLVGFMIVQMVGQGETECRVCVVFKGDRQCAKAVAETEAAAREEAQRSACSRVARGVTDAFACPKQAPDEASCQRR